MYCSILQKKFLFQTDDDEDVGFASKLDDDWINQVNRFVEEHIEDTIVEISEDKEGFLPAPSMFIHLFSILMAVFAGRKKNIDF